jgi:hypothetical protein
VGFLFSITFIRVQKQKQNKKQKQKQKTKQNKNCTLRSKMLLVIATPFRSPLTTSPPTTSYSTHRFYMSFSKRLWTVLIRSINAAIGRPESPL